MADALVTQVVVEVVTHAAPPHPLVTQLVVETLSHVFVAAHVTQVAVETLSASVAAVLPESVQLFVWLPV